MASSTTRPMARIRASKVSTLIEKPKAAISDRQPISDTGMVTAGTSVARIERRNSSITSTTSASEMPSAISTSRIEAAMNSASSEPTMIFMPLGMVGARRSISARTALEIAIVLAWLWRITCRPTAGTPLARTMTSSSSTPRSTVATSPSRTG